MPSAEMTGELATGRGGPGRVAGPGFAGALLLGACLAVAAGAEADPADRAAAPAASFELVPGVIVDRGRPAIYLMRPRGGIEALDPATGLEIWSTDEAAKPLAIADGLLLAQRDAGESAGFLPLVVLRPGEPSAAVRPIDAELPAAVVAAIDESDRTTFSSRAEASGDGAIVRWSFVERPLAGAPPPPGGLGYELVEGALRIGLEEGTAVPVAAAELAAGPPLPAPVRALLDSGELPRSPWRAGAVLAATREEGDRLVLLRWRAEDGEALARRTLAERPGLIQYPSSDGRHLLLSAVVEGASWDRWLWSIHALETGERLGELRQPRSVSPFVLFGRRLVHLVPPLRRQLAEGRVEQEMALRAVDLASGRTLWTRPLRDVSYRP